MSTFFIKNYPALKNRTFDRFLVSQLLSLSGGFIQNVALSAIISGFGRWQLGVFLCVSYLPVFALSFFTSKLPVRPTLIITELTLLAMTVYLTLFPDMTFWGYTLFTGIWGTVRAFQTPAAASAAKLICDKSELESAVAAVSLVKSVSRALGPFAAGAIGGFFGYRAAFLTNALSYIPSVILLFGLKLKEPEKTVSDQKPRLDKPLVASVFVMSFCGISYNLVFGGLIDKLALSRGWLAWFMAAVGVGAAVGAAILTKRGRLIKAGAGIPLCLLLLKMSAGKTAVLAIAVVHGVCDYLFFTSALRKINAENSKGSLKRAMGIYTALSTGALPLGYLASGFVFARLGIDYVLIFSALLTGAAAVTFFGKIR